MKNKITIVCCYNDRKQYGRLQASLAKQNTGYELIGMDNCNRQYASCSLALNAATARVETEYVIYAHPDTWRRPGRRICWALPGLCRGRFREGRSGLARPRESFYPEYSTAQESLPQPASRHFRE